VQENAREAARPRAGAQFACFTGTTVQILTLRTRAASWRARRRRASRARRGGESRSRGGGGECGGGGGGGGGGARGGHIAVAGICAHSRSRLARIGRRRLWRRPLGRWRPICACRACRGAGCFRPVRSGTPTPAPRTPTPTPTHTASVHAQPAAAERRCALT
jgi:hypothetical protein